MPLNLPDIGSFTRENRVEIAAWALAREGEIAAGFKWNPSLPNESEIDVGLKACSIIQEALKRADSEGHAVEEHLPLWDKFCQKKET